MDSIGGLVSAYILDGQGGGKEVGWDEINAWKPDDGLIWIHLDYSHPESQQWLLEKSNLDELTAIALMTVESRPRIIDREEGLNIFLRGVNLNPGSDPEDMVSVRVWIDQHRIISSRRRYLLSVSDLREAIQKGQGPKNQSDFVVMLVNRLTDRMADVIEQLDEEVDNLEEQILTADTHTLRPIIADTRRQAIALRRYLAPQRDAILRLQTNTGKWLNAESLAHLREANDRILRYIEDLDSARDRAAVTQEELNSRLSDQLNHRMYSLAVVAVIFLPLSFVTGLFGINVAGIPGEKFPWAFSIVSVALILFAVLLAYLFKKKKWM